ncbi:MAG TPA: hypothetical protein VF640_06305, partial [Acidimicrobiales bacterium]
LVGGRVEAADAGEEGQRAARLGGVHGDDGPQRGQRVGRRPGQQLPPPAPPPAALVEGPAQAAGTFSIQRW